MHNTNINIISVIFFEESHVADITLDNDLIFFEGTSDEVRKKVINELKRKEIKFNEREQ